MEKVNFVCSLSINFCRENGLQVLSCKGGTESIEIPIGLFIQRIVWIKTSVNVFCFQTRTNKLCGKRLDSNDEIIAPITVYFAYLDLERVKVWRNVEQSVWSSKETKSESETFLD